MTDIKPFLVRNAEDAIEAYKEINKVVDFNEHPAWSLTLSVYDPNRKPSQNALMWARHRAVAKETGNDVNYIHALSKRDVLLPYMLGITEHHARAKMISDDIKGNRESLSLLKCFDMVRSSDLTIPEFAEYMDLYQMYWGLNHSVVMPDAI